MKKTIYLLLMLLLPTLLLAQVTTSSITGRVTTPGGSGLEGASVIATHTPTGTIYKTVSRSGGQFDMQGLRVGGPYVVDVSYVGYKAQKVEGIQLSLGESFNMTVDMSDGETEAGKEVVVTAYRSRSAASVKTGASTIISNTQLTAMPTISRSITDFTRTTPQANGNSFGGRDGRYNNFQVDGANLNNNFGLSSELAPGGGSPISLDAFDEVSVNIAPYDVRQSGFTGAGINVVTKSGTNKVKGSVYGYTRNQNYYGYKVNGSELPKTPNSNNIIGATIGGPIIKNKLFFFLSAESEKKSSPGITWSPTGSSVVGNVSSTTLADLKKVYDFVSSKYGYDLGAYEKFPNFDEKNRKLLAKLDWNIDANNKLTLKYSDYNGYEVTPLNGSSVPHNGKINVTNVATGQSMSYNRLPNARFSANSMAFASSNYATNRLVRSGTLELNSRISDKMSNQFLATFTNINDTREPYGNKTTFPTVDIFNGAGQNFISLGTDPFTNNNQMKNDIWSLTDNFTYYLNSHKITAGINYEYQKLGNMFMGGSQGHYVFNSLDDFLNERAPVYYGYTYSLVKDQPAVVSANLKMAQLGLYIQDEYNVTPRLKLTYGVRVDVPLYGQSPLAHPLIDTLHFPNAKGEIISYNTGKWPKSSPLFSPRVGFNWDVLGDKSLIVRGGTGIFSGRIPFVFLTNMPSNSGMYQNAVALTTAAELQNAGITKFNPKIDAYVNSAAFPKDAGKTMPQSFVLIDPNFKFPQVWRTNLGVEKRFENGWVVNADIMYTRDINAVAMRNINMKASTKQLSGLDTRNTYIGVSDADKYYYPVSLVGATPIVLENVKQGNSFSATGQISKTFDNGFSGMVAYTYSVAKEISPNPGSRAASAWQSIMNVNGPNSQVLDYSQYAIPHRVIANLSYRINNGIFNFPTTLSVFYEGAHQYLMNYTINGSIVGDGNIALMYVYASGKDVPFKATSKYTVKEQQEAYDKFIASSPYLSKRKGQYVNRYGAPAPWFNQIDFKFLQDLLIRKNQYGKVEQSLQFSLDIFNLGNLLNNKWKNWGYKMMPTLTNPLTFEGLDAKQVPQFSLREFGGQLVDNAFTTNYSQSSTWSMQIGLRLNF